jgi:hypothetical protein
MTDATEPVAPEGGRLCLHWSGAQPSPPGWSSMGPPHAASIVGEGIPHRSESAALAYVGPALSRIPLWQVVWLLEDVRRVLRPAGTLRIAVYDALGAIEAFRRGDDEYFWESDWTDRGGRLADHLSESGAARSLFTGELVVELLQRAGFERATVCANHETVSGDERLVGPDPPLRQCVFVEGQAPMRAARPEVELSPRGTHLMWTGDGIVVVWSARPASRGVVKFREVTATAWTEVDAVGEATIDGPLGPAVFRALLADLRPACSYEYLIEQRDDRGSARSAPTAFVVPPGPAGEARLAFLADTGLADRPDGLADGAQRCLDEIVAAQPSVVLCAGDYAYRSSDRRIRSGGEAALRWFDQMMRVAESHPLLVQFGNHEVALGERYRDWAPHVARSVHGDRSFSCDVGPCHVVGLYVPTADVAPTTVAWLEVDLESARRGNTTWTIVFQHQPLFAHGSSHPSDDRVRSALATTFERHGVDLHLGAHDQSFERTFPIRSAHSVPVSGSTSRDQYEQGCGVVYAKVSPAGKRSDRGRSFSALRRALPPWIAASGDEHHHISVVRADRHQLVMETYGLTGSERRKVVDRFSIRAIQPSAVGAGRTG